MDLGGWGGGGGALGTWRRGGGGVGRLVLMDMRVSGHVYGNVLQRVDEQNVVFTLYFIQWYFETWNSIGVTKLTN